jgi:N-acetylmuramoyl-L-alanine amidase
MDDQFLKHTAINSIVLMLVVCIISIFISQKSQSLIYADNGNKINLDENQSQDDVVTIEEFNITEWDSSDIDKQLGNKYIIIKKPQYINYEVTIKDLYMDKSIQIDIVGDGSTIFDSNSFVRVNSGIEYTNKSNVNIDGIYDYETLNEPRSLDKKINIEAFNRNSVNMDTDNNKSLNNFNDGTPYEINTHLDMLLVPQAISASGVVTEYDNNYVQKPIIDPVISYDIKAKENLNTNESVTTFHVVLDDIYAHRLYQDNEFIYIDLRRPSEVYDKIIVIDAGHGGKDSGTHSKDEEYYEKDINLSIVLYLKEVLDETNFKVYYTRTTDQTLFLNPRVNFANDVEADLFLSVHCNASESPLPYGSEVLYNEFHKSDNFSSKDLAFISLEEITNITKRVNRGIVEASEMVIIGKAKMPVAIVEIAFMSNKEDLEFLLQESNQKEIANSLYRVIERSFNIIEQ